MKIKSLYIKEGFSERAFSFGDSVNLIHSSKNTVGKTTLLRLLLYSLGFAIPSTKKMHFDKCYVKSVIENDNAQELVLIREELNSLLLEVNKEKYTFILPDDLLEVHRFLFKCGDIEISSNILGTMYVDQEKGWTLLNRGKVIGNNHFNIEALIRGLSGVNCSELLELEKQIDNDCKRLESILSISEYQKQVAESSGALVQREFDEQLQAEIFKWAAAKTEYIRQLQSVEKAIADNSEIKNFIERMKIMIRLSDDEYVKVTTENIVGLSDSLDYLTARKKYLVREIKEANTQLAKLQNQRVEESGQMEFWQSETVLEAFDHSIMRVPINAVAVEETLKGKSDELARVRKEISSQTRSNNSVIFSLYANMVKYARRLGIASEGDEIASNFLFTSNLKELSGALLHKTVFAFRLAYILEVDKKLGIKLPIVLDSPKGKEVDDANIVTMMTILKEDFADHQIIIASIYEYDFEYPNIIEIENRLLPLKEQK